MRLPELLWSWPISLIAHGFAVAVVLIFQYFGGPSEPLFKEEDVLIVSMSGPPKSDARMVQKAERAPDAVRGATAPIVEPPPPNQSDMAFRTPDTLPVKGQANADLQRQNLLDDLKREQLLKDMMAPLGTTNRTASDPTGSGDGGEASAGINDPETAAWKKKMEAKVAPNWHPLISICQANPKLRVEVKMPMAPDGSMSGDATIHTTSGNSSLDQSALRAVQQTTNLPPPPAKFTNGVTGRVDFDCEDVL